MTRVWLAQARRVVDDLHVRVRRHRVLGEIYEIIDATVGDYARDHGPIYAGALAFYAILSLIPLAILFASAAGFMVAGQPGQGEAGVTEVVEQLNRLVPYFDRAFEDDLRTILKNRSSLG